jgi:RNA polymerase sigma factor (TIGR02999 family)
MKREPAGHTLQTTALVNEAYLRLIEQKGVKWQNRAHFFAISAQLMRRILVSMARARHANKRGGEAPQVSLDEALVISEERAAELVALDEAMNELAALDPRRSRVVELRYFGGLSVEETAEVLNISPETVMRDWKRAKAWLYTELNRK